ncbi:MAG: hypothetical protein CMO55_11240 [Verrucomicrobiales bacterium]|nr:hypothetical protein [Verrucomicrobiales bacterium]
MNWKLDKLIPAILIVAAIGVGLVWRFPGDSEKASSASTEAEAAKVRIDPSVPEEIVLAVGVEEIATHLHSKDTEPAEDLQILEQVIYSYRQATGSNPEGGENGAIADRLFGKNEKGVRFLPNREEWVNRDGELVDRWGTPYFFHSVSAEKMEIVSAGPDKELWTDDDVVSLQ